MLLEPVVEGDVLGLPLAELDREEVSDSDGERDVDALNAAVCDMMEGEAL